jgi:hypothetical protein
VADDVAIHRQQVGRDRTHVLATVLAVGPELLGVVRVPGPRLALGGGFQELLAVSARRR